jgi:hypothetical protein
MKLAKSAIELTTCLDPAPSSDTAHRTITRAALPLWRYARGDQQKLSRLHRHAEGWRFDGPVEPVAPWGAYRQAYLGSHQGTFRTIEPAWSYPPGRDPRAGAHFRAAYEIYAHVAVAERDKLPDAKLATIIAGQRPPDLTRDEAVAYDVAAALTAGGVLPELAYRGAADAFGVHGAVVSVTLNGFDVPVPEPE